MNQNPWGPSQQPQQPQQLQQPQQPQQLQQPQQPQQLQQPQQQTYDQIYNEIAGADDLTQRLPYFPDEGDHKVKVEDIRFHQSTNPRNPNALFLIIEGTVEKSSSGWSGRATQVVNLTGRWREIAASSVKNFMLALANTWYDEQTAKQWCENPEFHKAVVERKNGLDPTGIYLYLRTYKKPNQSRPGEYVTVHNWNPYSGEVENVNIVQQNQQVSQQQTQQQGQEGPPTPQKVPQFNKYGG